MKETSKRSSGLASSTILDSTPLSSLDDDELTSSSIASLMVSGSDITSSWAGLSRRANGFSLWSDPYRRLKGAESRVENFRILFWGLFVVEFWISFVVKFRGTDYLNFRGCFKSSQGDITKETLFFKAEAGLYLIFLNIFEKNLPNAYALSRMLPVLEVLLTGVSPSKTFSGLSPGTHWLNLRSSALISSGSIKFYS